MSDVKSLPFEEFHKEHGAKFAPFAGWNMPLQYSGVMAEHLAVRNGCGLFDVSHMGEFIVEGKEAAAFLQHVTCNDISKLTVGRAQYSALLNAKGGVIDDIIVYKRFEDGFLICVNASNRDEDFAWFVSQKKNYQVEITDVSDSFCVLAIQGKTAMDFVSKIFPVVPEKRFSFVEVDGNIVARTGYTGEDGVEVFVPISNAEALLEKIMALGKERGLTLCGLGARDSLRLEAAYPLHGHELSPDVRADACGLSWIIKPGKGNFIGRDTIVNSVVSEELVGLKILEPGIVRQGVSLSKEDGTVIGSVTSGTKTPSLDFPIAMARISKLDDTKIFAEVRGKKILCEKCAVPFYKSV